jgi:hypothetical protein
LKRILDRIYRIQRADRFKPNFQEPGIYHEKGKFGKHEKLVTQYSKDFWTQIPQISSMDRWKYPLRGNPNAKHCGQWETLREKNKLACFCSSRVPIVSSDPEELAC